MENWTLTPDKILADLKGELIKRSSGHRTAFNYRRVVEQEDREVLYTVDLAVFTLESAARVVAFNTMTRTKVLSDPSSEMHEQSVWAVGTLEDAAQAICSVLKFTA